MRLEFMVSTIDDRGQNATMKNGTPWWKNVSQST